MSQPGRCCIISSSTVTSWGRDTAVRIIVQLPVDDWVLEKLLTFDTDAAELEPEPDDGGATAGTWRQAVSTEPMPRRATIQLKVHRQLDTSKKLGEAGVICSTAACSWGGSEWGGRPGCSTSKSDWRAWRRRANDLERLAAVVDFELFRPELERAVPRADRSKVGARRSSTS